MFVRKVKRKCNVRGCRRTDCYAISRTREAGNSVIICKGCLDDAIGAIAVMAPDAGSNIPPMEKKAAPALFFNSAALGVDRDVDIDVSGDSGGDVYRADDIDGGVSSDDYVCDICGKSFSSIKGLNSHRRHCVGKGD